MSGSQTDPFERLSPDNVAEAIKILSGDTGAISPKDAAAALCIPLKHLLMWVERSRERREDDDPYIWELAEVYDKRFQLQAETLESTAFRRAVYGDPEDVWYQGEVVGQKQVYDNRLLMELLRARDMKYTPKKIEMNLTLEPEQIMERMVAFRRIADAKAADPDYKPGDDAITIEGESAPVEEKVNG